MATQAEPRPILTLPEAAAWLRVSERKLWELASEGQVPHAKVGRQYRFARAELERWVREGGDGRR